MTKFKNSALQLFSLIYLCAIVAGCASGGPNAPINANNNNQVIRVQTPVYARLGFQPSGLRVSAGDKVKINFTGTWSGGQRDSSLLHTLSCGAEGCNGFSVDAAGGIQNVLGFDAATCGLADGQVVTETYGNRQFTYPVPAGNRGNCCSSTPRVASVLYGAPATIIYPYECVPVARNALVAKILQDSDDPSTVPAFAVGRSYGTTPLTVSRSGQLYFASNDMTATRGDNSGMLTITAEIVP
jgi:hypothetical protein